MVVSQEQKRDYVSPISRHLVKFRQRIPISQTQLGGGVARMCSAIELTEMPLRSSQSAVVFTSIVLVVDMQVVWYEVHFRRSRSLRTCDLRLIATP